jgi:hypothetical protein
MKKLIREHRVFILKALGGILIFGSWIFQNYKMTQWQSKITHLHNLYFEENFAQLERDIFEASYLTLNSDSIPLTNIARRFAVSHLGKSYFDIILKETRILAEAAKYDPLKKAHDFSDSTITQLPLLHRMITRINDKRDIDSMWIMVSKAHQWDSDILAPDFNHITYLKFQFQAEQDKWNWWFMVSYILGSLSLGLSLSIDYFIKH